MKTFFISLIIFSVANSISFFEESFDVLVHKSIVTQPNDIYDVSLQIKNGEELETFAKLIIDLPEGVEFVSFQQDQELLKQSAVDKELKFIWMHLSKKKDYTLKFQVKSKLNPSDLKFHYRFWGLKQGYKVLWDWKNDWQEIK
jgi:hypothetical protein